MTRFRAAGQPRPTGPLVFVLLLMLALSGFLAYQAWDAARSHRQVTEAALGDYAGFAAWELRRRVESRANTTLNAALAPARFRIGLHRDGVRMAPALEIAGFMRGVENALRSCGCGGAVSDYFSIDRETRVVHLQETTLGTDFQDWLQGEFLEKVGSTAEPTPVEPVLRREMGGVGMMVIQRPLSTESEYLAEAPIPIDSSRVVVYTGGQHGDAKRLFGFVINVPQFVEPLITAAFSSPSLLPASLMASAHNAEMLSATVWSMNGDTLFRAGGGFTTHAEVVDTLRLATGALAARVAVRPEMAGQLVIGGLPRSRLPVLLGSVGLTLLLLLIAVSQLRRQQELFRLRADFVSGVSHELRTPLAQIRLFSDLLASARLDDGQRLRAVRILAEEAKRLTYLVENVLRFSRSERHMERIAPVAVEVGPLLREIVEDFAPLARSRDVEIEVSAPDGLRAPLDTDAVRQVLLNLLDNAVKYGPRGQRIEVCASWEAEWLCLEVDDEGPGVPASDRERVWEPYRRLSREVEAATGGSGIGLAIVRELVTLHGGRSFVTDGLRGGSRFVIRLPGAEVYEMTSTESRALEVSLG